jgi:cytochrome c oxidase subunit II
MINKALGLLHNGSEHGPRIDFMLEAVHWFMIALFLIWIVYFFFVIFRFRQSRNPKADYVGVTGHGSTYLEISVVVIEAVLLLGLAFPLWAQRVNQFPDAKDAVQVKVIGEQFAWNIYYPGADGIFGKQDPGLVTADNPLGIDRNDPNSKDDVVTLNQMHLPVNKPAIVHISSKDVIHSFTVRQMRITQDATPGLSIPAWFTPTVTSAEMREKMARDYNLDPANPPVEKVAMEEYKAADGTVIVEKGKDIDGEIVKKLLGAGINKVRLGPAVPMEIACAQLCGMGHYKMRGFLTVDTEEEYAKWMSEQTPGASSGGGYE